jgi:chloramphenicol-sensitive protein RarD
MNKGVVYAIFAYIAWGLYPIYFKLLDGVPPLQIMAHRVVWSFIALVIIISGMGQMRRLLSSITQRAFMIYMLAGLLIALNWYIYVFAVATDRILEGSLGYFINPLVSVVLGVVFLRERLRPLQWIPVALAAAGVAYLTLNYGQLPWIALTLAFTFGLYGLVKKLSPLPSLPGLTLETGLIFVPAFIGLLVAELNGSGNFTHNGVGPAVILALSGVVTIIPLLLFSSATRLISLTTVGLLQYIAPTLQFLTGVLLFGEKFTPVRVTAFSIIWLALLVFSLENILHHRKIQRTSAQALISGTS